MNNPPDSPEPSKQATPNLPSTVVIIPRDPAVTRRRLALAFAAVSVLVVGSAGAYVVSGLTKAEAQLRHDQAAAASDAVTRRIDALQSQVNALRAKLQAMETREQSVAAKIDLTPVGAIPSQSPENQSGASKILTQYRLRGVSHGVATIESAHGATRIAPGEALPGAGKILGLEKRAGHWIVAAENGEIVERARAETARPHFRPALYGYPPMPFGFFAPY